MTNEELVRQLVLENESKIVLLIMDGLGDIADPNNENKTPLEMARTENLDKLAARSACGMIVPILPGITPGSGPAHLALFGYDPLQYEIGRGVLETAGLGIGLTKDDVAARANFATVDKKGIITDRRAGRIPTEKTAELCKVLSKIDKIDDVRIMVYPGKVHRFVVILQGKDLSGDLSDSDPHHEGSPILEVKPLSDDEKAKRTAEIVNRFIEKGMGLIKERHPANAILMRGFSMVPRMPTFMEKYKLRSACIATYPMYRGLSKMVGMDVLETGETVQDEFQTLIDHYDEYDYFFIHIKGTDTSGEDGNFREKVDAIEVVDKHLPMVLDKKPDVLAITGDHSTPILLKSHSWHPVPVLLSSRYCAMDDVKKFDEKNCARGGLGIFPSMYLMNLMMANAKRLDKFGA